MKKLLKDLFETWYCAGLVWCVTGVLVLLLTSFGMKWLGVCMVVLHVAWAPVMVCVLIRFLFQRRWLAAFGEVLLGVFPGFVFFIIATIFCWAFLQGDLGTWCGTPITEDMPFSVEYNPAHPFLSEYHKRITFQSGKRIALWMDTGGAGSFAVYQLTDGSFYLVDGLDCAWIRSEYRVNPVAETVELKSGASWVRIPKEARSLIGRAGDTIWIETAGGHRDEAEPQNSPVGQSLDGKRFLGYISPRAVFVPGGEEPILQ